MYSAPDDAPGSGRLIPAGYAAMTPLAHRPATMAENAGTPGRNDYSAAERPAELHKGQESRGSGLHGISLMIACSHSQAEIEYSH